MSNRTNFNKLNRVIYVGISLMSLVTSFVLLLHGKDVRPAYGLDRDQAYLLMTMVSCWLLLCGAGFGIIALTIQD